MNTSKSPLFILDTFRISKTENPLLPFHIQRTWEAIQLFHPQIPKEDILKMYRPFQIATSDYDQKCRLVIDPHTVNLLKSEITAIDLLDPEIKLACAANATQKAGLGLQNFKTTDREYWDNKENVIGVNTNNHVTETSRFNLFIKMQDQVFTPTLKSGCVNGCLRRSVLTSGFIEINQKKYPIQEKDFTPSELQAMTLYIGNSLRGITKAFLATV